MFSKITETSKPFDFFFITVLILPIAIRFGSALVNDILLILQLPIYQNELNVVNIMLEQKLQNCFPPPFFLLHFRK